MQRNSGSRPWGIDEFCSEKNHLTFFDNFYKSILFFQTGTIGDTLQKLLKSDPVTSELDFDLVAPFFFTSEHVENGLNESDSLKDCIQTASTNGSEMSYENSWVTCQGKETRGVLKNILF